MKNECVGKIYNIIELNNLNFTKRSKYSPICRYFKLFTSVWISNDHLLVPILPSVNATRLINKLCQGSRFIKTYANSIKAKEVDNKMFSPEERELEVIGKKLQGLQ